MSNKHTLQFRRLSPNIQGMSYIINSKQKIMLKREAKDRVRNALKCTAAVVLLGARQVGKTTLAHEIAKEHNSIYLDLESPEDLMKLTDALTFLRQNSDRLIILDEIQRAPNLFPVLRGIIDQNKLSGKQAGQFLLLGSASMDLLRQSSESLAGRISYVEMSGLTLLEVDAKNVEQLWLRGGFPDSYLAKTNEISWDWRENFIRTYLERDVPQLGFRVPATRLRRLWTMLAHIQGENINFSKLAANLEVDAKTVVHYLEILEDLLLVRRINPWYENVKKRLVKSPRFYVRDSGILHKLLGVNDVNALLSHPILGKSWEGFVLENILSVIPTDTEAYFYRTSAGAEVDLLLKFSTGKIWAIEVKYGVAPKIEKGFYQSVEDLGVDKKYIVYSGDSKFNVEQDVEMISLLELLKKI